MPGSDDELIEVLDELKQRLKRAVLTESQFTAALGPALAALATKGLYLTITVSDKSDVLQKTYGSRPALDAMDVTRQEERVDTENAKISVVSYRRVDADGAKMRGLLNQVLTILEPLLKSHWGTRDEHAFVFDRTQMERFRTVVRESHASGIPIAVIMFDLDHFKEVNDNHGHAAGDTVLRDFGQRLRKHFAEAALIARVGGEEFAVVWIGVTLEDLIRAVSDFRKEQNRDPYPVINRTNFCSIGVAFHPTFVSSVVGDPYDTLKGVADRALYVAKTTGRNRIRWSSDAAPSDVVAGVDASAMLEIALNAKVFARGERIAEYGALHAYVYGELRERLGACSFLQTREVVDQLLADLGIDVSGGQERARPTLSQRDLTEVIVTALLGNVLYGAPPLVGESQLTLRALGSGREVILELDGGAHAISLPALSTSVSATELGPLWRDRTAGAGGVGRYVGPHASLSPYVTLSVGAESLRERGREWSAAAIPVDDRPVISGGLPDFWQSNITRAIQTVLANPNVRAVVILGDEANARRTITMLRRLVVLEDDDWRIARRLGLEPPVLREFVNRRIQVHVVPVTNGNFLDLVRTLVLGADATLAAIGNPRSVAAEAEQRARLPINLSRDTLLSDSDGLRVATLADAYPRVIQLLRSSQQNRYADFMGSEFVELTAFKVALSNPLAEIIPDYWSDDVAELDGYYEQRFRAPDGLFGSRLQTWGDGESQITKAVGAAVEALSSGVGSRRILFVAPRSSDSWQSPIGLISGALFPRVHGNQRRIDFLWMWRTVEALVGFPFSAYGSIRESAFLMDAINCALRMKGEREAVCGELVYFAASLHFFLGAGHSAIARTVVRDAIR